MNFTDHVSRRGWRVFVLSDGIKPPGSIVAMRQVRRETFADLVRQALSETGDHRLCPCRWLKHDLGAGERKR